MKAYAGIGSRETPKEVIDTFVHLASFLAKRGYTLRSGAACGSDQAFEKGCDEVKGFKEIWLPWKGFENSDSKFIVKDPKAFELAQKYHPNWTALKQGGQKLQARNCHQVLGETLDNKADFIICWTKGGSGQGGTGQALRLAKDFGIPIFDFGKYPLIADAKDAFNVFYADLKKS